MDLPYVSYLKTQRPRLLRTAAALVDRHRDNARYARPASDVERQANLDAFLDSLGDGE